MIYLLYCSTGKITAAQRKKQRRFLSPVNTINLICASVTNNLFFSKKNILTSFVGSSIGSIQKLKQEISNEGIVFVQDEPFHSSA